VSVLGYEGYYDAATHGIRYTANLPDTLAFWFDASGDATQAAGAGVSAFAATSQAGIWRLGLPPDEKDSIRKDVDLIFTADGKAPKEVTRSIIIKPRPLVPAATHATLTVGDPVPFRFSYSLALGYDGKTSSGALIGDGFDFTARKGDVREEDVPLRTTYQMGDPAGDYPIYAMAGTYGERDDYEIYEGTEGNWPFFKEWRFAGVLHVNKAAKKEEPKKVKKVKESGTADTGDSSPLALWTILLIASLAAMTILIIYLRRRRTGRSG
jgi:hypothetical protein